MHTPIEIARGAGAGGARLRLQGTINLFHAAALHAAALEVLAGHGDVRVECAEVEHLDSSALQVLLALAAALRAEGRALRLQDVPAGVQRYLRLSALDAPLAAAPAAEVAV